MDELLCAPLLLQQPQQETSEVSLTEMATMISSCPEQLDEHQRPEAAGGESSFQSQVSIQSDTGSVSSGIKPKPKGESIECEFKWPLTEPLRLRSWFQWGFIKEFYWWTPLGSIVSCDIMPIDHCAVCHIKCVISMLIYVKMSWTLWASARASDREIPTAGGLKLGTAKRSDV